MIIPDSMSDKVKCGSKLHHIVSYLDHTSYTVGLPMQLLLYLKGDCYTYQAVKCLDIGLLAISDDFNSLTLQTGDKRLLLTGDVLDRFVRNEGHDSVQDFVTYCNSLDSAYSERTLVAWGGLLYELYPELLNC